MMYHVETCWNMFKTWPYSMAMLVYWRIPTCALRRSFCIRMSRMWHIRLWGISYNIRLVRGPQSPWISWFIPGFPHNHALDHDIHAISYLDPIPIGSMVLLYMVTWIPSIYPLYVSIYTSTMDPSWDMLPSMLHHDTRPLSCTAWSGWSSKIKCPMIRAVPRPSYDWL